MSVKNNIRNQMQPSARKNEHSSKNCPSVTFVCVRVESYTIAQSAQRFGVDLQ